MEVFNVLHRPGGSEPASNVEVEIRLVASLTSRNGGFDTGDDREILGTSVVETDAAGRWAADLTPNDEITPGGTYYEITEKISRSSKAVWTIEVPSVGAGPLHIADLLTTPPSTMPDPAIETHANLTAADDDVHGTKTYTDSRVTKAVIDALGIDASTLEGLTVAEIEAQITAAIVDASPETLDTLNELAAALGDDANFAATVATQLGELNVEVAARQRLPLQMSRQPHGMVRATMLDGTDYILISTRASTGQLPHIYKATIDGQEIIDFTNIEVAEVPVTCSLEEVVWDAARERAYVLAARTDRIQVLELDPSTMAITTVVDDTTEIGSTSITGGPSITTDGTYVYVATYRNPAKLVKYRISDWAKIASVTFTGKNSAHAARYDSATSSVFVTGASFPAWIAKVDTAAMTYIAVDFPAGDWVATDDFAVTETHVWVGLEMSTPRGAVCVFDKTDLSLTRRIETGLTVAIWGVFWKPWSEIWIVGAENEIVVIDQYTYAEKRRAVHPPSLRGVNEVVFVDHWTYATSFDGKLFFQVDWSWSKPDAVSSVDGRVGAVGLSDRYSALGHLHAKADLPASVAYEDEANTFTSAQTFQKDGDNFIVRTAGGSAILTVGTAGGQPLVSANASGFGDRLPLRVRGYSPQTASLQEWQGSDGVASFLVNSSGEPTRKGISATQSAFLSYLLAEGDPRLKISVDGKMEWGNGITRDTNLYRSAADILKTDDSFDIASDKRYLIGGARFAELASSTLYFAEGATDVWVRNTGKVALGAWTALAQLDVRAKAAGTVGQVVRGAASQTANLQEWQNSAGTMLANIDSGGNINANGSVTARSHSTFKADIGSNSVVATIDAVGVPAAIALRVRAAASQTGNLQEWQDSAGTVLARIAADGHLRVPYLQGATSGMAYLQFNVDSGGAALRTQAAANKGLVIRGAASQTANLQEWQNDAGVALQGIQPTGRFSHVVWNASGFAFKTRDIQEQTTVGAAGAASVLPAAPTKYLKVQDSTGATLVVPAYAAA